jgi:hypothetical protein
VYLKYRPSEIESTKPPPIFLKQCIKRATNRNEEDEEIEEIEEISWDQFKQYLEENERSVPNLEPAFVYVNTEEDLKAIAKYYFVLAADARLFNLKHHSITFNDRFESTLATMCRAFFNEERLYNRRKRTRAERSSEASDIGAPIKVLKEDSTLRRKSAAQPKQTGRETPVLPTVVAPLGNDTEQPTGLSDNVDAMDWRATTIKMTVSQERHKSSLRILL